MSDLFRGSNIRITNDTLEIGGSAHPTRKISHISDTYKTAPSLKTLGFGAILCLFGLWAILQMSIGLILAGLASAAVGFYIIRDEWETMHFMYVELGDIKEIKIEVDKEETIKKIRSALFEAMK
jgi:hypothetical protein